MGCWEDGTLRALDGIFIDDSSKMSPAWCLAQCAASGYNLGGLEYSNQCLVRWRASRLLLRVTFSC